MKNIASTVRQTTLMPPTTPPMMGPNGVDSLGARLVSASFVADASGGVKVDSVDWMIGDVVAGGVVDGVCKVLLDEVVLEGELVDDIVVELDVSVVDDDDVVVAETVGGFA
jgi:hypothetical protein